jgi:hypothetical protein
VLELPIDVHCAGALAEAEVARVGVWEKLAQRKYRCLANVEAAEKARREGYHCVGFELVEAQLSNIPRREPSPPSNGNSSEQCRV